MTCSFTPFGGGSRVVSLWDMLRFYADKLVEILNMIDRVESMLIEPETFLKNEGVVTFYASRVKEMQEHLEEVRLPLSAKQASKLHMILATKNSYSPESAGILLKRCSEELRERLADELAGRTFFYVSDHEGLLSDPLPFGEPVGEAFPSAQYDISEAGRCLVLKRSTACVLHLMRALELRTFILQHSLQL